jgi:hypothetical protein
MKILKETKKALLIEKDGIQFWIQRRWMKSDNTLTPAGVKAFENKKSQIKKEKEYINISGYFEDYSEKAIKVNALLEYCDIEKDGNTYFFAPKSMLKNECELPRWFLIKKLKETEDYFRNKNSGRLGSISVYMDIYDDNHERIALLNM